MPNEKVKVTCVAVSNFGDRVQVNFNPVKSEDPKAVKFGPFAMQFPAGNKGADNFEPKKEYELTFAPVKI